MRFQENIKQRLTGRHFKSFSMVGEVKSKVILDIGCSFGWFERFALDSGCKKIIGIDLDSKNLENAKNMVKDKRVEFLEGSVLNLSKFQNDFFDIVVMWEVIEHIPKGNEKLAFLEINRVLKTGGFLFLSTPNKTFWSCVLDPAWWLMGHRHYNKYELEFVIEDSGFEIAASEYGGGFYELISMILLYIFKWFFNLEIPFKAWFEEKRNKEFFRKNGFTTLLVGARKV